MRNPAFDGLKTFAIFLVLWGHCIQHLLSGAKEEDVLFRFIYSFHMPLFAMVSGYFCSKSINLSLKDIFLRRGRQLLLPCFTWFCITYALPKIFMYPLWGASKDYSFLSFADVLYQNFWFLKSMFVCFLLAYIGKHISWILAIIVSFFLADPTFNISFLFPSFAIGYSLRKYGLENLNSYPTFISTALMFLVLFVIGGGQIVL